MMNQPAPSTGCSRPVATYAHDPAAQAFDDLRAEVSVMRRALEAMPQAFDANRPPDYARDIAQVKQAVDALTTRMASLEKKPALTMTPTAYAQEIERAGQAATEEARIALKLWVTFAGHNLCGLLAKLKCQRPLIPNGK